MTLTLPDGTTHQKVKARIDSNGVTAWVWDRQASTGVEVYSSTVVEKDGRQRWASEGATLVKAGGCGCSNPMKRWTPPGGNVAVAG